MGLSVSTTCIPLWRICWWLWRIFSESLISIDTVYGFVACLHWLHLWLWHFICSGNVYGLVKGQSFSFVNSLFSDLTRVCSKNSSVTNHLVRFLEGTISHQKLQVRYELFCRFWFCLYSFVKLVEGKLHFGYPWFTDLSKYVLSFFLSSSKCWQCLVLSRHTISANSYTFLPLSLQRADHWTWVPRVVGSAFW